VSYNQPVAEPPGRPATVTAAGYLMIAIAVLVVLDAIVGFATLSTVADATKKAYAGVANGDQMAGAAQLIAIVGFVVQLLLGAGFVVLALLDLRGVNPARIVTWVLGGLGVLCFGCGLLGSGLQGQMTSGMQSKNGVDLAEASRKIHEALPSWLQPLQLTTGLLNLLMVIAVIILLALPASNAYFRRGRGGPGTPDPGFPTQPYPQQ
jgi:hypothetical protein